MVAQIRSALRGRGRLALMRLCLWVGTLAASAAPRDARASSVDELIAIAERHAAQGEEAVALRRYADALEIDPTCEACYLGLGAVREKMGDLREADRVYTAGLLRRVPEAAILAARARVRWGMGLRELALADLEDSVLRAPEGEGLHRLLGYYGQLHASLAQLRVARQLLALGERRQDEAMVREASVIVKALVIVAGSADPVTHPPLRPDAARRALAQAAARQ